MEPREAKLNLQNFEVLSHKNYQNVSSEISIILESIILLTKNLLSCLTRNQKPL